MVQPLLLTDSPEELVFEKLTSSLTQIGEMGEYVNCASVPVEMVMGPTVANVVPQAFCATMVDEKALLMMMGPTG